MDGQAFDRPPAVSHPTKSPPMRKRRPTCEWLYPIDSASNTRKAGLDRAVEVEKRESLAHATKRYDKLSTITAAQRASALARL
jgi:hypothetical protein